MSVVAHQEYFLHHFSRLRGNDQTGCRPEEPTYNIRGRNNNVVRLIPSNFKLVVGHYESDLQKNKTKYMDSGSRPE